MSNRAKWAQVDEEIAGLRDRTIAAEVHAEKTAAALAAAQAEVAELRQKYRDADFGLTDAVKEIAALRRVIRGVIAAHDASASWRGPIDPWVEMRKADEFPSAAEPLMADIRAAVEAMESATHAGCSPESYCGACEHIYVALTALRRWVP